MSNNSIFPIDRTLSGAATPSLSGSGINGNEGVFNNPKSFKPGASPSDCLTSYLGHSLGGSYPSAEYSTAPTDWADYFLRNIIKSKRILKGNNYYQTLQL